MSVIEPSVNRPSLLRPLEGRSSVLCWSCLPYGFSPHAKDRVSRKQPHLSARVPEQAPCRSSSSSPPRTPRDQAGHRLGRVGRIEKERLGARQELDRFARLRRRHAVAVADEPVVDLDLGAGERALVRIGSWTNQIREARQNRAGRRAASVAAGSSALMPTTRVRMPASAHPATSPACVPPDEVEWTMTSGGVDLFEELRRRRARTRRRRAASRRRAGSRRAGGQPRARSAATASISGARSSRARRSGPPRRAAGRAARWRSAGRAAAPLATSTQRKPSLAAAAAVTRAWFDCTPPHVISVSACRGERVSATSRILRTLLPPNANPIASSRFTSRRGPPPSALAQPGQLFDRRRRGRERHRRQRGERAEHNRYDSRARCPSLSPQRTPIAPRHDPSGSAISATSAVRALATTQAFSQGMSTLLDSLRSHPSVIAAELRPPRAELATRREHGRVDRHLPRGREPDARRHVRLPHRQRRRTRRRKTTSVISSSTSARDVPRSSIVAVPDVQAPARVLPRVRRSRAPARVRVAGRARRRQERRARRGASSTRGSCASRSAAIGLT